jgi:hypothetical protein
MLDLRKELCYPPPLSIGCAAAFAAQRIESNVPKLRLALARSTTNPRLSSSYFVISPISTVARLPAPTNKNWIMN